MGPTTQSRPSQESQTPIDLHAVVRAMKLDLPPVEHPPSYGWAMASLATALILLPTLFGVILTFLGWLVVWHCYQLFTTFAQGPYFLFHLPMALVGGLLLTFLIKPIFFRHKDNSRIQVTLTRKEEPLLFEFVDKLCAATGAPTPAIIEVDCEPNAAVIPHRGLRGVIKQELSLRIGLPLMAGLSVADFAGVLGHELGHFNQRGGMIGTYIIRSLTALLARIVFERDKLDLMLFNMRRNPNAISQLLYWSSILLIESARGVFWVMMLLSDLLACRVLRQMEYDADRLETQISGTAGFIHTSQTLMMLSLASQTAKNHLAEEYHQQRLADNLAGLIARNAIHLLEIRQDFLKAMEKQKTAWYDTHPSYSDRLEQARDLNLPPTIRCDVPAKKLLSSFNQVGNRATKAFYDVALKDKAEKMALVPYLELAQQQVENRAAAQAVYRYFRGEVLMLRPLFPDTIATKPADDPKAVRTSLGDARDALVNMGDALNQVVRKYTQQDVELAVQRHTRDLADLFPYSSKAKSVFRKAKKRISKLEPICKESEQKLDDFEFAGHQRLTHALQLAHTPTIQRMLGGDAQAMLDNIVYWLELGQTLQSVTAKVKLLREESLRIQVFMGAYSDAQPHPPLVDGVLRSCKNIMTTLTGLRKSLEGFEYPFAHKQKGIVLGEAIIDTFTDVKDPSQACDAAWTTIERFSTFKFRVLGKLTTMAEGIEKRLGLEPLPEPEDVVDQAELKQEKRQQYKDQAKYWIFFSLRAFSGTAILILLFTLSFFPPSLPSMGWNRGSGSERRSYQPMSFSTSSRTYYAPPATRIDPTVTPYSPPTFPRTSLRQSQPPTPPNYLQSPPPPPTYRRTEPPRTSFPQPSTPQGPRTYRLERSPAPSPYSPSPSPGPGPR